MTGGKIGRAILELLVDKNGLDKGLGESVKSVLNFESAVKGVGKVIAGAFAATAIIGAAASVVGLAGDMTDLGAKTGIGVEALQELKYAGSQVGVELETVTSGVNQLQKRLAGGDSSAVGAIKSLGLNFDELRAKAPEDQFEDIAKKVAAVEDPADRVKLAMDLFGKSGAEMLPLLSEEFTSLMDRASDLGIVMDEETVAAMDTLGDTVGDLTNVGLALIGKVLAPFIPLLQTLAEGAMWVADVLGDGLGWAVDKIGEGLKWLGQQTVGLLQSMVSMGQGVASMFPTLAEHLGITQGLATTSGLLESAERALTAEQDKGAETKRKASGAVQQLNLDYKDSKVQLTDAQKGQQKYNDELRRMADTLTGKALEAEVKKLADAYALAAKEGGITAYQSERLGKQLHELLKQGAQLEPPLAAIENRFHRMNLEALPLVSTLESVRSVLGQVNAVALSAPPALKLPQISLKDIAFKDDGGFIASFERWVAGLPVGKAVEPAGAKSGEGFLSGFASSMENLGPVIVGAFQGGGDVGASIGATLGNSIGLKLGEKMTEAVKGSLGKMLGSFCGPLGSLLGGFLGNAIGGICSGNDTKKDREQVAKMMGFSSSTAMYAAMREMGADGQRLVHEALNVIGKKDHQAQAQWTANVQELFEAQKAAAAEAAAATEDAAQREVDATKEVTDAIQAKIDTLDKERSTVFESIREELENPEYDDAGNRIYGVIEAQGLARIAELDAQKEALQQQMEEAGKKQLSVAEAVREGIERLFTDPVRVSFDYGLPGLSGGESLPVGLGRGMTSGSMGVTPVVLTLDGRVVARNQVNHFGEALEQGGFA